MYQMNASIDSGNLKNEPKKIMQRGRLGGTEIALPNETSSVMEIV